MGRVIHGYTPPSARPTKPTIFVPIRGIYCRGTSGNDVEAGPLLKTSAYTNLKNAVAAITTKMQRTFDGGLSTFQQFLSTSGGEFDTAIDNYKADLGAAGAKVFEIVHPTTQQLAKLKAAADAASGPDWADDVNLVYDDFGRSVGSAVVKNVGPFFPVTAALVDEPGENSSSVGRTNGNSQATLQDEVAGSAQGCSQLTFVNYCQGKKGQSVVLPGGYGLSAEEAMTANGPIGGQVRESIVNYFDEAIIAGDPVRVERLFSTYSGGLEKVWTDAEQAAFLQWVKNNGSDETAWAQACVMWPTVFCAYRIEANFNFLADTKWESMGQRLARRHPRILPHLLTGYNTDAANPTNWRPLDIPIEISADGGSTWTLATYMNGLQLSPDGQYFLIPALREYGSTIKTWRGTLANPAAIVANDVLATLAVEADFRVTGYAPKGYDPTGSAARIENDGDNQLSYLAIGNEGDYVEWLRHDSAQPLGSAVAATGVIPFPAKMAANDELFSDRPGNVNEPTGRIITHAMNRQQDVKRVEAGGYLEFSRFDPGLMPGAAITEITGGGIPFYGVVKAIEADAERQTVLVHLG